MSSHKTERQSWKAVVPIQTIGASILVVEDEILSRLDVVDQLSALYSESNC